MFEIFSSLKLFGFFHHKLKILTNAVDIPPCENAQKLMDSDLVKDILGQNEI